MLDLLIPPKSKKAIQKLRDEEGWFISKRKQINSTHKIHHHGSNGKMVGNGCLKFAKSPEVFDCLRAHEFRVYKGAGDKVTLGDDNLVDLYKQHHALVAREFSLTSHSDPLCIHEFAELKILMHENARDRSVLFP